MRLCRLRLLLLAASLLAGCAGARIRQAQGEVAIIEDVPYLPGSPSDRHRLDLYLPRGARAFPVVLFVHGGFWRNQGRRYLQGLTGLYGNVGVALARRGIGVAVQSYRLSPEVGIEEQLSDVRAALRYLSAHVGERGGDPRRLVLAGFSAGGHLSLLLGLDPARAAGGAGEGGLPPLRGLVSLSGLLDVGAMAAGQDAAFNRDVTYRLFGKDPAVQSRYSPLTYLGGAAPAPRLLLLWAERDYPFVRQANLQAAERLRAAGVLGAAAAAREIPGYGHADMVLKINGGADLISGPVAAFVKEVTAPD